MKRFGVRQLAAAFVQAGLLAGRCAPSRDEREQARERIKRQQAAALQRKNSSKMNEQRGNLYENKGQASRSLLHSGNVVENRDSYPLKPGMLLKARMLAIGREPFFSPKSAEVNYRSNLVF